MTSTARTSNFGGGLSAKSTITGKQEYITSTNGILNTSSSGGGGGIQYQEGAITSPGTGTLGLARYFTSTPTLSSNNSLVALTVDSSQRLLVNTAPLSSTNDSVSAVQSGGPWTQNITQVGGSALSLGSTTSANSIPVTLASNDTNTTPFVTSGGGGYIRQDSTATIAKESGGNLTTLVTNTTGIIVAQGSTTSGQSGQLIQGAVTTNAPTYSNAQTSPLSLTTTGLLRVGGSPTGSAVPANAFYIAGNDGTNLVGLNAAQTTSDAVSTTVNSLLVRAVNFLYNNNNLERQRSNVTGVVIAAGATTSNAGVTTTTFNASKAIIIVNISAFTSGSLTVQINGITSSGYSYPILTSTALASVAVTPLRIFPGATPSANAVANDMVPRSLQVVTTVSGTLTYGIDYELSV